MANSSWLSEARYDYIRHTTDILLPSSTYQRRHKSEIAYNHLVKCSNTAFWRSIGTANKERRLPFKLSRHNILKLLCQRYQAGLS